MSKLPEDTQTQATRVQVAQAGVSVRLAVTAVFAALIAVGTILSIPLPPPLFEITWAPAIYLALALLSDQWTAFSATAIGSFFGEAYNVATRGGPPIYAVGMVWARAPEVLIVAWARRRGWKTITAAMVLATVFETVAFLIPDWAFYTYGVFGYGSPVSVITGFYTALPDVFTMVDIVFIPIAIVLVRAAAPAFRRLGFA
jgi:hypothetical protein